MNKQELIAAISDRAYTTYNNQYGTKKVLDYDVAISLAQQLPEPDDAMVERVINAYDGYLMQQHDPLRDLTTVRNQAMKAAIAAMKEGK